MKLSIVNNVKSAVTPVLGKAIFAVKKASPDLLMATGVVGFVATNVLSARSSLKLKDKLEVMSDELDSIRAASELIEEELISKDLEQGVRFEVGKLYVKHAIEITKLYLPSIIVGGLSIAALVSSNRIQKSRNLALVAAYQTVASAYNKYRERVRAEFGEEKDFELANFVMEKRRESFKDAEGNRKTKTVTEYKPVVKGASPYARFFDELSNQWQNQAIYNLTFLRAQEAYFNDRLISVGHVFLNEVYDALGIPRTKAGQVVGWSLGGDGDNHIDFGIYDLNNPSKRAFVNGFEKSILLDFNVDGVIYDKIED